MKALAQCVRSLHVACILFILFGWALPVPFLKSHLLGLALVMIHWWTNRGQCVLTQIEKKLRGETAKNVEGAFVSSLFAKIGRAPSRRQMMLVIYGLMFLSGWISARKLGLF